MRYSTQRQERNDRQAPQVARPTPAGADPRSEALLRDMAFVLHLTRQVRQSIEQPTPCLEAVAC